MKELLYENHTFEDGDYHGQKIRDKEFDACTFIRCNFSDSDFFKTKFIDCKFIDCNLSNAVLAETGLQTVMFKNCKLIGLDFQYCSDFLLALEFEDCQMDFSSFFQMKIPETKFNRCKLEGADFIETDLTKASFEECNLLEVKFENTTLERVNFQTAYNFRVDPELNKIRKAKFSRTNLEGLLVKYQLDLS